MAHIDVEALHVATSIVDGNIDQQLVLGSIKGGCQAEDEITATLGSARPARQEHKNADESSQHHVLPPRDDGTVL